MYFLGKIYLINFSGKIEKTIEAHEGAVLMVKWSSDGSSFASCKYLKIDLKNTWI